MTHQPFEDWLLYDEPLTPSQKQELQVHLRACEQCTRLASAWRQTESALHRAPVLEPEKGFSNRWQVYLVAHQLRLQRRQRLGMLLFSIGGASLLLTLTGLMLLPVLQSPKPLLIALAYQVTRSAFTLGEILDTVATVFGALFGVVPPTFWVGLSVAAGSLAVLWLVAVRKLTAPGRVTS